jgi:phosphoribosylformimino-5-aminoimidazole carboxamide ribotide isomerase
MLLIPAIDIRAGRCVRLSQGDFAQESVYATAPRDLLRRYRALGVRWVHIVDLDGARHGVRANHAMIADLAGLWTPSLQVGGGVRSRRDVETLLDAGVARVVVGSTALHRPDEVAAWLGDFGPERLCLAFDVRSEPGAEPLVCTHGWRQQSGITLWSALGRYAPGSVRHVLCTDVARDGTLSGPNLALYRAAVARFPSLAWQASGGIRNAADLTALAGLGVSAAVSGKALLEERIPAQELRPFLPDASSPASTSRTAAS